MRGLVLAGGWGYENLGDEAILAGYLEYFGTKVAVQVASVDPSRTSRAQRVAIDAFDETREPALSGPMLLGGGGYLNGRWVPEIYGKLRRLARLRGQQNFYAHGIEVRRMDTPYQRRLMKRLAGGGHIAVRDEQSSAVLRSAAGTEATVLPDAIALLYPHLDKYIGRADWAHGKIVVNLLDIGARGDSDESLVPPAGWDVFVDALLQVLGDRALLLVGGDGDRRYINSRNHKGQVIEPNSVGQLVSTLAHSDGVFSVRMHPGLIASALGKPVVSVPYCGKVLPTLARIGVEDIVLRDLDVTRAMEMMREALDHSAPWSSASSISEDWLEQVASDASS